MKVLLGKCHQQGDVLMYPILNKTDVLKGVKKKQKVKVLHQTTQTSNQHRVLDGSLELLGNGLYLTGKTEVLVTHVEHDPEGETPLVLKPNTLYLKVIVAEQDHVENVFRRVVD